MDGTNYRSDGPELKDLSTHFRSRAEKMAEDLEQLTSETSVAKIDLLNAVRRYTDCKESLEKRVDTININDIAAKAALIDIDGLSAQAQIEIAEANLLLRAFDSEL